MKRASNFYKVAFASKEMKRGLLIMLLVLVVLASYLKQVSAGHICSPEQVIISLYATNNSHAAIAGEASAPIKICYDDFFPLYSELNPQTCTATNLVINLTSTSNAHAGSEDAAGHNVGICYGDLSCTIRSGACIAPEVEILALNSLSNAHLALDRVTAPGYQYGVCCSNAGAMIPNEIKEVYWADINGIKIPSGKIKNVNQTLQLAAHTTFGAGQAITFSISEDDCILGNPPCSGDDAIATFSATTNLGGIAQRAWTITDGDILIGSDVFWDNGPNDLLEFYFNASASGTSNISVDLLINKTSAPLPPRAKICNPEHRQMYFISREISFEDCSTGAIASSRWTIEEDSFTNTGRVFNHTFTSPGQKTITLHVEDIAGAISETQIAILLLSTEHDILAFINEPYHRQIVNNSRRGGVYYNANDSYVVNNSINSCSGPIICLAGKCPVSTKNPWHAGSPSCTINATISDPNKDFSELTFNWTFSDGSRIGGIGRVNGTKSFGLLSRDYDDKWIKLLLSYDKSGIILGKETRRNFTLLSVDRCLAGRGVFIDYDEEGYLTREIPINAGGCVGADGFAGINIGAVDDCCPSPRYECKLQSNGLNGCSLRLNQNEILNECGDYITLGACHLDEFQVAYSIENPERNVCGTLDVDGSVIMCPEGRGSGGCVWKRKNALEPEKCWLNTTSRKEGDICGQCFISSQPIQECNKATGFFTLRIDAHYEPGSSPVCSLAPSPQACVSTETEVYCLKNALQLPLFGLAQVLLALGLIVLVYIILFKTRLFNFHLGKKLRKR